MKRVLAALGKAALYIALFDGMQALVALIFGLALGLNAASDPEQLMALTAKLTPILVLDSGCLALGALYLFFRARGKSLVREASLNPPPARTAGLCLALGVTVGMASSLLAAFLPFSEEMLTEYSQMSSQMRSGNLLVDLVSIALVAPLVEEVVFRGLVMTRLGRAMPLWLAGLLTALAFAAGHGMIVWSLSVLPISLVLSYVAIRCRSTFSSFLLHAGNNLLAVLASALGNALPAPLFLLLAGGSVVATVFLFKRLNRLTRPNEGEP